MRKVRLTVTEWHIAVAAYAYEVGYPSIMSDYSYDTLAGIIKTKGKTGLPGFEDYTGSWVKLMDQNVLEQLYQTALGMDPGNESIYHPAIIKALIKLGLKWKGYPTSKRIHEWHKQ